jgi:phage gp46-like protein
MWSISEWKGHGPNLISLFTERMIATSEVWLSSGSGGVHVILYLLSPSKTQKKILIRSTAYNRQGSGSAMLNM